MTTAGATTSTDPICPPGTAFAAEVQAVRDGVRTVEDASDVLVGLLTQDELLGLLDGDVPTSDAMDTFRRYNAVPFEAGRVDRLGIPGIRFTDGPRGVVMGASTSFPVAIARAATFDTDLERRVGDAVGREARAQGANLFAGICVNLPPAPGWGRSQESYGEDPLLQAAMGAAAVEAVNPWVMSCIKHFALNSMEEARFTVDVRVPEDVLHEQYLPHFRAAVAAGADCVMSAYNSVNGEWAGQNRHLLTEVLRDQWGFPGFVMTDFVWGLRDAVLSVQAGQDLEMPFAQQRAAELPGALADGRLARADVERCARRILAAQLRLALRAGPAPPADVVACDEHRALARETAALGSVLLRNEPVDGAPLLPLDGQRPGGVAVLGRLADQPNQGDTGSSRVRPPTTASVVDGLRERLGDRVVHVPADRLAESIAAARDADVAVVVVGLTARDEGESIVGVDGETVALFGGALRRRWLASATSAVVRRLAHLAGLGGGDRADLHLHRDDVLLVEGVAAVNPRTVVVVVAGGTVMLDPWDERVPAVLLAWYPGMEGGRAVADVLLGEAEPGGRLPFAIPRRRADLPVVDWRAAEVDYPRWYGQRKLDRERVAAAYPFGFGLGYTQVRIEALEPGPVEGERFTVRVTVTNVGHRPGRHVVQVYASQAADPDLPTRALVGFAPVAVPPGSTASVVITCSTRPLQRWTLQGWRLGLDEVGLEAASFAGDPAAAKARLVLPASP